MNATKASLIAEIEKRVSDKILEQTNADLLIKLIKNADSLDEAINIAALGTTYRRTGLHFDKRLEKMSNTIKYFKKNEALSFHTDDNKPTHKLIIGDNYEALQNLLIQYRGKVDVIYIDPPYGKDSMGEFAQTNYNNAITRDNLLSMLYPRLVLAKQLLSEDGVIFCSIDDKNQAYVKCLFDEVFWEINYITTFPKKGTGGRQDSTHYAIIHEYCLCYTKCKEQYVSGEIDIVKRYKYYDSKKKLYYNTQLLRKWGDSSFREDRPNMYYPIYYNELKNKVSLEREDIDSIEIYPMLDENTEGRWRWGKSTMEDGISENVIVVEKKKKTGEFIPYEKIYANPDDRETKLFSSWIEDIDSSTGTKLLKKILPNGQFDYPKATDYIFKLLEMTGNKKDAIILDFFAGTGTTGHAILDLNLNDGGNRTYILCQLNEKTDTTPNGIAYDVTAKRLKRVMTGECYDGTKDFEWIKKNEAYGGNLDVYEIGSVSNFEWAEGKTPFDVIDETLYGKEKFKTIKEKIDWVCGNFDKTQSVLENNEDWLKRIEEA